MAGKFGYAGKILRVDLSSSSMSEIPTANYADRFLGGRGIAAKIYWDEVPLHAKAFDPENRLIFMTGPLAGLSGLAGSRWEICGKSSANEPEHFSYSDVGGSWGAFLKFTGYDGIVIKGKSQKPVYLIIQDGIAELRDASGLWGRSSIETRNLLKAELGSSLRVAAIGPAGENMVSMATILADEDSSSSGLGAVMGSKKLKAVAVSGGSRSTVANPERFRELNKYVRTLKPDVARDFLKFLQGEWPRPAVKNIKQQRCYGCIVGCTRETYEAANGDKGKSFCQAGVFYERPAINYYGEKNEVPFQATRLCDSYGLDTMTIHPMIDWLARCYNAGILSDENTGIPISKLGSLEFIESLLRKISLRDGFGDTLANGIYRAVQSVGKQAEEIVADLFYKAGQRNQYDSRLYITTGIFWAMEPRLPIAQLHAVSRRAIMWKNWTKGMEGAFLSGEVIRAMAKKFWGSELAADFSTYEGKALAAKMIQEREYAIACLILCNRAWPIMEVENSEGHVGDPTLESKLYSAVTGNEVDEEGLYRVGERVFNLQRAILVREGHRGREDDRLAEFNYTIPLESDNINPECLVPGKDSKPLSKKGAVVDREKYEEVLDEYYQLRSWDVRTGLQKKAKLEELGLEDVAEELEHRGLAL